jgi:ABC-type transporter Mla subunit MlaD
MAEITIRISNTALRIARVLLGGTLLVCVFSYLWWSGFFIPKYQLSFYVPEASGLTVHAPVRIDGIQVGSVRAMKLAGESASPERRIELVLRVEKRDQDAIRSDSNATLVRDGLLGNRYVNITRGFKGSVIKPGGEIPSIPPRLFTFKDSLHFLDKAVDCLQQKDNAQVPTEPAPKTPQ